MCFNLSISGNHGKLTRHRPSKEKENEELPDCGFDPYKPVDEHWEDAILVPSFFPKLLGAFLVAENSF